VSALLWILPTLLIVLAVGIAVTPLGLPDGAQFVLPLMPYMMAHLFVSRGRGFVPSPVIFLAGIFVDIASGEPLGFWAFIYLFGVLIARQLPDGLMQNHWTRLSALLLMVFALSAAQVALASLYQLKWINWHAVLSGTLVAGAITALFDLMWLQTRSDSALNVTDRGARQASRLTG
jgi:cell shape-determining protein MreD